MEVLKSTSGGGGLQHLGVVFFGGKSIHSGNINI